MSLHPTDWREIPADTAALGHKLLPEDNLYRLLGDQLSGFLTDEEFADLYTPIGGPAISPVILSLLQVFQMIEKLSDRQAAEALIVRIDWKYALHLPLEYPGFYFTNLSHFRARLLAHQAEYRVFDHLVQKLVELGFIRRKGKQRTDSTHILGQVAKLNRLELVWETLRVVLQALKRQDENWVKEHVPESFLQAHLVKQSDYRMSEPEMKAMLRQTGADGWWLLQQLGQAPQTLRDLLEVQTLRTVWEQQFEVDQDSHYQGPRQKVNGTELIQSPHDPDVRYSEKRGQGWKGYRAQVTETAEAKGDINFITDVEVTNAQLADVEALPEIQARLAERNLSPSQQFVDQGYISTQRLADSQAQGIGLIGPINTPPDGPWFPLSDFQIDWEQHQAHCPGDRYSVHFSQTRRRNGSVVFTFRFGQQCAACPLQSQCTPAKQGRTLSYQEHHELLVARKAEMQTQAFWKAMQARPPIEGTISQLVRQGARRARYRGQPRVNLHWILTALAVNFKRLQRAWASGYQPSWIVAAAS